MKYHPTFIGADGRIWKAVFVQLRLSVLGPHTIMPQSSYLIYFMLSETVIVLLKIKFDTIIDFEVLFVLL
jgi:hypothetical protein